MDTMPDTVYGLLHRGARQWPERELILLEDGTRWTWYEALAEGARAANALAELGVGRGDRVMMVLPNGPGWLRSWWGATLLGAMIGPVNPAVRGQMLAGLCHTIEPTVIVAGAEQAENLEQQFKPLVVSPEQLTNGQESIAGLDPEPTPSETHLLLTTSGTTGPAKASVTPHAFVCHMADWLVEGCSVDENDVFQGDLPWFHMAAFAPAVQMLRVGGRIAARSTPAMGNYWQTAKEIGSTFAAAPGTISQFLEAQSDSDSERDHSMRFMICAPLPADPEAFIARFGLEGLATAYGSSEANLPLVSTLTTGVRAGTCGTLRPGFQVRLVDDDDNEVPPGTVGEAVVRADQPWMVTQGYVNRPDTTVAAWRNLWFHTGDGLWQDAQGYYHFHDRFKDVVRRRGENISSFEVEREVAAYPGIAEVACVAHPSDYSDVDDEVKVFIVPEPDATIDYDKLVAFLADRMTYYMVPRYYETINDIPKTPTQRIQKHILRDKGNNGNTWDREAAGYKLTRNGLATPS